MTADSAAGSTSATGATRRRRVLFVAEAVTLAHVARPVALAKSLDPSTYEVYVAWDPRFADLFPALPGATVPLRSIACNQFAAALAKGSPLYDSATLRDYVRDDLAVLERVKPDLVVGDFRLSLAVSAPLAGIPYFSVTNAYWSPCLKQSLSAAGPAHQPRPRFVTEPRAFPHDCADRLCLSCAAAEPGAP